MAFGLPAAGAAGSHRFDPLLSLKGDCSTSSLDEVPDPGICPGTVGVDHPPKPFKGPCGTAVDPHGDIYVVSPGIELGSGKTGRIDVFGPAGNYLTEIPDGNQPCNIAVDSLGNVYVVEQSGNVVLFEPDSYPPTSTTKYGVGPKIVFENTHAAVLGAKTVAVDPSDDHLYVAVAIDIAEGGGVREYDSAASGSALLESGIGDLSGQFADQGLNGVAVYGGNHDIYLAGDVEHGHPDEDDKVFVFSGAAGHAKKLELDGSNTPSGDFNFKYQYTTIAVDQATGDFYVEDSGTVEQFDAEGNYLGSLDERVAEANEANVGNEIAVDNPCRTGPSLGEPCSVTETYDSPNAGHVYFTSGVSKAHLWAFAPVPPPKPPTIEGQTATESTATEVVLKGKINPEGLDTTYHFEYVSQQEFDAHGYANAASVPVPDADAGEGGSMTKVAEPVTGLNPGTTYRFRLVASNHCDSGEPAALCTTKGEGKPGEEGTDAAFSTYEAEVGLPDGRAYELVTPASTNGRIPTMAELGSGFNTSNFNTSLVVPGGESVAFGVEGGSLPELGGSGIHDTYEAVRGPEGWQSHFTGLSGAQAQKAHPGGIAMNHIHSFWQTAGTKGTLALGGETGANYIRRPGSVIDPSCSPEPEGHFELVGCGSLGTEPYVHGTFISPDGDHILFDNEEYPGVIRTRLEPCAPPTGTSAVYDRTSDGVTHCISMKPDNSSFSDGEDAEYLGASSDGSAVAFGIEGQPTLYVRLDNAKTVEAASGKVRFAGLSENGGRLFYLRLNATEPLLAGTEIPQGDIFACDVRLGPCFGPEKTRDPVQIGSGEKSLVVNVSADGSHVYFISSKVLDQAEEGEEGKDNLYVWNAESGAVALVAVVDQSDVSGEEGNAGGSRVGGLGLWMTHAVRPVPSGAAGAASDPSRSTPDGAVLVFESRASLTGYDNAGHREVYRYAADNGLTCVSCNPTGVAATSEAQLQSNFGAQLTDAFPPVNEMTPIANVTTDGKLVFFQSADRLANGDVDGRIDVYEWEAEGAGGCAREGGCIRLISGGRSFGDDYLYAATPDGSNVFFESGDLLVPQDLESTPSIYDARVGGGFPAPAPPPDECLGETCQPTPTTTNDPTPASAAFHGPGNRRVRPAKSCPRGQHRVRRAGKVRCQAKHKSHKHKRGHGQKRTLR